MKNAKDRLVAVALFALSVNLYVFHRMGSIGTDLVVASLWALTIGLFGSFKRIWRMSPEGILTLWVGWLLVLLQLTDSSFRTFLILAGSTGAMIYVAYLLMRGYFPKSILESVLSFPQVMGEYFGRLLSTLTGGIKTEFLDKSPKKSRSGTVRSIVIGLSVGIPLVIWMASLLSKADPIFAAYVNKIISKEFLQELPVRVFVSLFVFMIFLPTLFMTLQKNFVSPLRFLTRERYDREMSVILTLVVFVLGTFLVIQWPYIFVHVASETQLAAYGIATYSEYVQKGFGELVRVVGIVFVLSWISLLILRSISKKVTTSFLIVLQTILGIESLIFVLSIFRRVILYTQFHGLSLARMYGVAFLTWLIGMGIMLMLRFFKNRGYARYEVAWTALLFLVTVSLNMEAIVLTSPPTVNARVDYYYLARMSADGSDGWIQAYTWAKDVTLRSSQQKTLLTRETRREMYYARLILDSLLYRYADLALKYGSSGEMTEASKLVNRGQLDAYDRFLSWNGRQKWVYDRLQKEILLTDLYNLKNLAYEGQKRIDAQPANERDFEMDISPETPLL